jgi:membrane peptidoglycan carboxypeptidase
MSSHGDDFKVTALQLGTLVAAMANGGRLITPFVARTPKEETRSAPKVRRVLDIKADSFKQMIPGMVGSVSYGSGRRASNSDEVIAGKTGTCIEQGAWIGLFTSYAPLSDPRLAVVVIARGADGRNHFPAAVAGRIYRDLGARFGATTTQQMASSASPQLQRDLSIAKSSTSAAENDSLAAGDDESEDTDEAAPTAPHKTAPPVTIWGDPRRQTDSKVKLAVMPISDRTQQTAKHSPALPQTKSNPTAKLNPTVRPRRVTSTP